MKVYTRGGDAGETSLFGGARVRKDVARVEAYGAVDELNAVLGIAIAELSDADLLGYLRTIQEALFELGGELATPDAGEREIQGKPVSRLADEDVAELERRIDGFGAELEPLRSFILPGGAPGGAHLHHARTVCRRAERRVVHLAADEPVSPVTLRYLNRLSDLLFVMARVINQRAGAREVPWRGRDG